MILEIAFSGFLFSCSYTLIQLIPELKKFLLRDCSKNYITNIYSDEQHGFKKIEQDQVETKIEKKEQNIEEKLNDVFLSPSLKNIKTNFKNLGEQKKSKKINDEDINAIRNTK